MTNVTSCHPKSMADRLQSQFMASFVVSKVMANFVQIENNAVHVHLTNNLSQTSGNVRVYVYEYL